MLAFTSAIARISTGFSIVSLESHFDTHARNPVQRLSAWQKRPKWHAASVPVSGLPQRWAQADLHEDDLQRRADSIRPVRYLRLPLGKWQRCCSVPAAVAVVGTRPNDQEMLASQSLLHVRSGGSAIAGGQLRVLAVGPRGDLFQRPGPSHRARPVPSAGLLV